ncbi:hypothetical protein [Butyrivibrio sp.]|uniref:hypothetical protein n=1 Tax=Butyrivibrio sp. TaxID=28121 RepID=UPI0025C1FBA4|nr:hypothetical protein [Butyrivibrio sp.]MBQ7428382.1 hypothetical protein [Butyrivibrio sp.]MBQ9303313.1 hypothetical protein [Butyrivibrio sp.]
MSYEAYGIDMSTAQLKPDAAIGIMTEIINNHERYDRGSIMNIWDEFVEDGKEDSEQGYDENLSVAENYENFMEYYKNEDTDNAGIEGLIADFLNEKYHGGRYVYCYEDYCIVVAATIPVDEEEKNFLPTQADIQRELAETVGPLLEEPVTVKWLDIFG